jgi:sialate O-acetylesterase
LETHLKRTAFSLAVRGALLVAAGLAFSAPARADVKLPSILGSNMVLQREKPCPIWGWAAPGEDVTVRFAGQKHSATADAAGNWSVRLDPMKASKNPRSLTVDGKNTVKLDNVLVGEVWLCSGQSNMEWTVALSDRAQEEIAAANEPLIRHIKIPHRPSTVPEKDVPSDGWKVTTPQTVPEFTAVGYFFARSLVKEMGIPVGLIGSNWGGTRIEPWIPPVGFRSVPALKDITDKLSTFPSWSYTRPQNDPLRTVRSINFQTPLALYNGMIAPLVPFAIRGALWYQGESNNGEGMLYYEKMKALINGWRSLWGDEDMPFYFVQLAPFNYGGDQSRLSKIWDAQRVTLNVPHTGMAVITDIGNLTDIHPKNKQEVGRRLALWALTHDYDREVGEFSGPLIRGATREGSKVRLTFTHVGDGLVARDNKPLTSFTIAGKDGNFVPATAVIEGDTVVVSAPSVSEPTQVWFAGSGLDEPNFFNRAGLPASPFYIKVK